MSGVNSFLLLKLLAVLGCGLMAGVFFAFSNFVMKALERIEPSQGITAMQSINITVINPLFMTVFLGTGAVCVFILVFLLLGWHRTSTIYLLIGCLLYLVGTLGVTIVFNVPLNEALALVQPDSTDGVKLWANYLKDWTFWNHIRAAAALAASALFTLG
ncbi:DUF1772 domain-containing protein [Nostoc sp. FACHB-152]|uniref:anthrone oxygenase family protein n=2 Tax=unclassified Nostoc TaxID=2593658 RepID=UPI0016883661|nr:anthrone oxygenase family protein [Nostoc sp. FACHB-145]MBD2449041.1 DUF1772 domain-containing protein [Nostoc sp. FACHB-152]MBD2469772.1 DUF1772 domain-containing protein [Nostoc sp. FACHB-145]